MLPGKVALFHRETWAYRPEPWLGSNPLPYAAPQRVSCCWEPGAAQPEGSGEPGLEETPGSAPVRRRGMTAPSTSTLPRGPAQLTSKQHKERAGRRPTPLLKAAGSGGGAMSACVTGRGVRGRDRPRGDRRASSLKLRHLARPGPGAGLLPSSGRIKALQGHWKLLPKPSHNPLLEALVSQTDSSFRSGAPGQTPH